MENIKIYENPEFGKIRTTLIGGVPYFVGKDVAVMLGYNQPHKAIAQHVDEDDGMKHTLADTIGRPQGRLFFNYFCCSENQTKTFEICIFIQLHVGIIRI